MNAIPRTFLVLLVIALASLVFLTGLNWGLPSRDSDAILFGSRQPWTGAEIMGLAGAWQEEGARGADIAMHPLPGRRERSIIVNDTDAKRAQIVRRYRLYSNQPDEMITFRSLSRMKPETLDLDPRLYQYGGLWIYPVGALLKIASLFHLITIRADLAFYLDNPQAFGRFYTIARAYSACWGLVGVCVVFLIGREWTGNFNTALTAAALYSAMPVVIDLAHEAKPHLAGTVLILLTIWLAMRYVRVGRSRWYILAGITAGAAMGMVLTGYVAFAVLPMMTVLRPISWRDRLRVSSISVSIGIAVFALSDPYLPIHLVFGRQVLNSNVGNYGNFYQPKISLSALMFAARCVIEGLSPPLAIVGGLGAAVSMLSLAYSLKVKLIRPGLLLAAPFALVAVQFVLLGDGKTAEYGRFALMPDVVIALVAAALIGRLPISNREKTMCSILLVSMTLYSGIAYDLNFLADNRPDSTRRVASRMLQRMQPQLNTLGIWAEPAPYCLPPVDLFHWQIVLLPRDGDLLVPDTVTVRPIDAVKPAASGTTKITPLIEPARADSPISWANKPIEILRR